VKSESTRAPAEGAESHTQGDARAPWDGAAHVSRSSLGARSNPKFASAPEADLSLHPDDDIGLSIETSAAKDLQLAEPVGLERPICAEKGRPIAAVARYFHPSF